MSQQFVPFDDGEAYEQGMGAWSQLTGQVFLDWLEPSPGLRWIDVGCGNGAFTELLAQRCAPAEIYGIDPSAGQLAYAQKRPGTRGAIFVPGNATAIPFEEDRFDVAVMALVLFFLSDPARGIAEMRRVVRPGGLVTAYLWDVFADGVPASPGQQELLAMGIQTRNPPSADVSRIAALHDAWIDAGLEGVESKAITVQRTFVDFEQCWRTFASFSITGPAIAGMVSADLEEFKARLRSRLPADRDGRITYSATANAVKGFVPQVS